MAYGRRAPALSLTISWAAHNANVRLPFAVAQMLLVRSGEGEYHQTCCLRGFEPAMTPSSDGTGGRHRATSMHPSQSDENVQRPRVGWRGCDAQDHVPTSSRRSSTPAARRIATIRSGDASESRLPGRMLVPMSVRVVGSFTGRA